MFTPRFPDFESKVRASFARQGFMRTLNAELTRVEPGFCEIVIPFDESLTQQHGFFHAGIVGTLADNAAGYAAFSLMEETSSILTVEFKLNLLAPADGDVLIGRAQVLKNGKTLTICRTDVYVMKNARLNGEVGQGVEKLCAACQSTLIELKDTADS